MPNRIIKDSITKSEKLSEITDFQFRLWVHLITYVDDYGRGDARPAIIRGSCFPLRERVTNKDIEKGLAELAGAGCVGLYTVDGKPYLYFPNWEQHQRVRQKVSKCPAPEENGSFCQVAADCGELPQDAARIQNTESKSRIQNPNTNARESDAFDTFWDAYPRKEGKQKAKQAFAKVSVPVEVLLEALDRQKKSPQWTKDGGQFIPHASTWLNGKRWEDETDAPMTGATGDLGSEEMEAIARLMGG